MQFNLIFYIIIYYITEFKFYFIFHSVSGIIFWLLLLCHFVDTSDEKIKMQISFLCGRSLNEIIIRQNLYYHDTNFFVLQSLFRVNIY